jgi:hypothetical protein
MQSVGTASSVAPSRSSALANQPSGNFNSKLISGLKKSGNGIVVKVPAGVRAINVKTLRSPSSSNTNLSKAESVRVSFNNSAKDNYVTLRFDADGNVHASVIEDMIAERELGETLRNGGSDVGIINGKDSRLNEKAGLRIRESINGKLSTGKIRFLTGIQLAQASPRLKGLFEKFRTMSDKADKARLGVIKEFRLKVERRHKDPRDEQKKKNNEWEEFRKTAKELNKKKTTDAKSSEDATDGEDKVNSAVLKLRHKINEARKKQGI